MDTAALVFLFQEKLMLYHELIEVLKAEREWIVLAETDRLWQASDRKQRIACGIEDIRQRILEALIHAGISHEMKKASFRSAEVIRLVPLAVRIALRPLQNSLILLKEEIQQRTRENVAFVEEYLSTLDDLIGIFTRDNSGGAFYDRSRQVDHTRSRSLMHREV
ncbi:MAG: flagellar export chaperone FlgN [Desulfobacterales bacterium]|jgi:hypothetical protein|nr:flagellar export chaperone FlgN [Desulfobacterales bacterium]